jgi:NitT/TauT family transport system substrate-binding protein
MVFGARLQATNVTQRIDLSRAAFLATLPAGALAAAAAPALGQTAAPMQTVRIGATANDTYAEAYYAQDKGFFTAAGLNAPITTFTNGAAVSSAVASGALDMGVTNPVQLANAVSHGIPFVYFIGGAYYSSSAPTTVLCVAAKGPIRTPKDFEGQTIAVSALKDLTDLAKMVYLEKAGVNADAVKTIELPFAEMGPALERGTVAGAVISEPSLTNAVQAGQARVFAKVFDALAPRFLISGWFTTKDWYAKNTVLAKKVAATFYQTARWANANQDDSGKILMNYSKVNPALLAKMTRAIYAETLTPALIDPLLQISFKAKLTDRLITGAELIA